MHLHWICFTKPYGLLARWSNVIGTIASRSKAKIGNEPVHFLLICPCARWKMQAIGQAICPFSVLWKIWFKSGHFAPKSGLRVPSRGVEWVQYKNVIYLLKMSGIFFLLFPCVRSKIEPSSFMKLKGKSMRLASDVWPTDWAHLEFPRDLPFPAKKKLFCSVRFRHF